MSVVSRCYLAVVIGGTRLLAGVVDDTGQVVVRDRIGTPQRDVWSALRRLVLRVIAAAPEPPVACGIGCGGPMNPVDRTVSPLHIPSWVDFPLADQLEGATQLAAVLDNDAKAMALGERWCGAAVGIDDFVGVVIGAGVGGGIVSGGRLLRGRMGNAGHIGHVIVEPGGRPCPCGGTGCLEAYCSGSAIEQETGRSPLRASAAIVERTGLLVGRAVASVAPLLDTRLAVVGGTIALSYGEPFFAAANAELAGRAKLSFLAGLQVVPSLLGTAAPLVGAASLARSLADGTPTPAAAGPGTPPSAPGGAL